jgi:hypothetical protein
MRPVVLFAGFLGLAALSACSPEPPARDKAYYVAHEADRTAELAACQNDPGGRGKTRNCLNAQAAVADVHALPFYDRARPASRVQDPGKL